MTFSPVSSFSSFVAKPSLRLPILAATVVATVATSAPPPPIWDMADRTEPEQVHADHGQTVEAELDYSSSQSATIAIDVQDVAARDATLRIEVIGSEPDCTRSATFTRRDGSWLPGEGSTDSERTNLVYRPCSSPANEGTLTVRVVNESDTALDFAWFVTASIDGMNSDTPPPGAFVRVRRTP